MWSSSWARVTGAILALALFGGAVVVLSGCSGSPSGAGGANGAPSNAASLSQVTLEVPTIWCSTCKPRVEASARSVAGVKDVQFDRERIQIVVVTYGAAITTPDAIIQAIEEGGDKVTKVTKL